MRSNGPRATIVLQPEDLQPTTQLGKDIRDQIYELIAINRGSKFEHKLPPAPGLSAVFAQGTPAESSRQHSVKRGAFRIRGTGYASLAGIAGFTALVPPLWPAIGIGVVVAGACERIARQETSKVKIADAQAPQTKQILDRMIKTLNSATQEHVIKHSDQTRLQLNETLTGFCSLFSSTFGYTPQVFNGRRFSLGDPDYSQSSKIQEINEAIDSALEATQLADGASRKPRGGVRREVVIDYNHDPQLGHPQQITPESTQLSDVDRGFQGR